MQYSPPRAPAQVQIAPLGLRLLAFGVDFVILSVLNIAVAEVVGGLGLVDLDAMERQDALSLPDPLLMAAWLGTTAAYYIIFVAIRSATPGKMMAGIMVSDRQGQPVTPDTAILRHLAYMIGGIVAIGTIASIFLLFIDPGRRTVHDRVARTLVIRREPQAEPPPHNERF